MKFSRKIRTRFRIKLDNSIINNNENIKYLNNNEINDYYNLKDILLVKYDDYDEKELESLNNHLDEVDLESKCNNKNIKGKNLKSFII